MNSRAMSYAFNNTVDGWLNLTAASVIDTLYASVLASKRSVCEIGVHHGKLLIFLHLITNGIAVAIDLFANQVENIDGSGMGDIERLRSNFEKYGSLPEALVPIAANSMRVCSTDILEHCGSAPVLFSIDGGHTRETTRNDLELAASCIASDGMVILDDVFNEWWPEVSVGLADFLSENPKALIPFCIVGNKVLFAKSEDEATKLREKLERTPNTEIVGVRFRKSTQFWGNKVINFYSSYYEQSIAKLIVASRSFQRFRFSLLGTKLRQLRRNRIMGSRKH